MRQRLVIFNGPPGCGKDTAADFCVSLLKGRGVHLRFKTPLYRICAAIYGIDLDRFVELATDRHMKELETVELNGKSPRSVMIEVSESVLKPFYGKSFFGGMAAKSIIDHREKEFIFFSDGGFSEELTKPIKLVNPEDVVICRLHIDGQTCEGVFENDSRKLLQPSDVVPGVRFIDVNNKKINVCDYGMEVYNAIMREFQLS